MKLTEHFGDVLDELMLYDGRHARQLETVSSHIFGEHQKLHHNNISRWRRGEVARPRNWQAIFKLAVVLRLTNVEADRLLAAAGHLTLNRLKERATSSQDKALLTHWQRSNPAASFERPFQVPPRLTHFTGRRELIRRVAQLLQNSQYDIYCFQGMGGVGKSSLVNEIAYLLQEHFTDGVLWISLPHVHIIAALRSIAAAYQVDVSNYRDLETLSSRVRSLLAEKKALLVLDGAVDDKQLRHLLPPTGACIVIITTRRHDLAAADNGYRLSLTPFAVEEAESLALFSKIVGQATVEAYRDDLARLADLLGHLPLAIALAASRIKYEPGWTPTTFLQRIQEAETRLSTLERGDRQVRLLFEGSYETLHKKEQALFALLGLFAGKDFGVDAVAFALDILPEEAEEQLRGLYNLSLVTAGRNGRYQLHRLLQDFSRQKQCPYRYIQRLIDYFVGYIQTNAAFYPVLDTELSNILGALKLAAKHSLNEKLIAGVTSFYSFLQARGLYDEASNYLAQAEEAARRRDDKQGLLLILKHCGSLAVLQGAYDEAAVVYGEALELSRQTKNQAEEKILLTKIGVWAYWQGDYDLAKRYYEQAIQLAQEMNDPYRIAVVQTNLAVIANDAGQIEQAEAWYQQALKVARKLKDTGQLRITVLQNLGDIMDKRGNYETSMNYLQEGFALAQEKNEPELESRFLLNIGLVAYGLQNYAEATNHFRRGITLAQKSRLTLQLCRHYASLGLVETAQNNFAMALVHFEESLALAKQLQSLLDICKTLNWRGDCYLQQHQLREAADSFQEAKTAALQTNLQVEHAKSLYGLARVAEKMGNLELAQQQGLESAAIFSQAGHKRTSDVTSWLKTLPKI